MRSAQITIKDIAKELGISPSTVSRALKDHPDISEKTKNAVRELAQKLNYKPNAIALSLRQSKSNIIGVIVPQIVHHFFSSVISGIEHLASKNGYNVLICQSDESYEKEVKNTQTLISSRVDGIIISRTKMTVDFEHFKNIEKSNIPMVFFDRTCPALKTDEVIIDDFKAAFNAVEHLINTGCKKIAHYKGPKTLMISKKRLEGFLAALKKHKLPVYEDLIIKADTFKKAQKVTQKLIKKGNIPDAVFAVNDMTAIGAINSFKKHGIKIPEDVSVTGFTNGLISTISDPTLTTVEQHGFDMGDKAGELLLNRINSKKDYPPIKEILPTKLIIRGSTKN